MLLELTGGDAVAQDSDWSAFIRQLHSYQIIEIDVETYDHFLVIDPEAVRFAMPRFAQPFETATTT